MLQTIIKKLLGRKERKGKSSDKRWGEKQIREMGKLRGKLILM